MAEGLNLYVEESLMYYVQQNSSIMARALSHEFSEKNFDMLKMTDLIAHNRDKFELSHYQFFMDQIVPIHTFLRFVLKILRIKNNNYKAEVIRRWGAELNRIVPQWYKSINKIRLVRGNY